MKYYFLLVVLHKTYVNLTHVGVYQALFKSLVTKNFLREYIFIWQ